MTDLISRADAMGAVQDHFNADGFKGYDDGQKMMNRITALPSADAEPTVIRSKTLLPTKDFKEWAKRVRETNPNVIVIPCDAEVVSADAVQGWIPCSERLPEKDELVLVTVWDSVSIAWRNIYGGWESAEDMYTKGDVTAWMPLPKPYREDGE